MKLEPRVMVGLAVVWWSLGTRAYPQDITENAKNVAVSAAKSRELDLSDVDHRKLWYNHYGKGRGKGGNKSHKYWKGMNMKMQMKMHPMRWAKAAKSPTVKSKSTKSKSYNMEYKKKVWPWYGQKGKGKGFIRKIGVDSFVLVDSGSNKRLMEIQNGDVIAIEDLMNDFGASQIAFECITFGNVGSAVLSSSNGLQNVDSRRPWTLHGDLRGNYFGISLVNSVGTWTLSCQPFSGPRASGLAGPVVEITFSLSSKDVPDDSPIPTVSPSPESTDSPTLSTSSPSTQGTESPTTQAPTEATESPTSVTSSPTQGTDSPTSSTSSPTTIAPTQGTESPTTQAPTEGTGSSPTAAPTSGIVYGLQPDCYVSDETRFNICLDISSESGEVEDWFGLMIQAKERWERIINGDPWGPWSPETFNDLDEQFVATSRPQETVDDMYLAVIIRDIDGPNGRYAEAGPDLFQSTSRPFPVIAGSIIIDPPDLDTALEQEIFLDLMVHEIGHVMGFGTFFAESLGNIENNRYIGENGVQAWRDLGCEGDLPLENDESHWSEDCMVQEVLTPILQFRRNAIFSSLTMAVLEDLGYNVNRAEEDAYSLDDLGDCGDFCPAASRRRHLRSSNSTMTQSMQPRLSEEAENELIHAAADRFRRKRQFQRKKNSEMPSWGNAVSYIYQENGRYYSRTIHEKHVQHLL